LEQDRRAEIFVRIPPVARAAGRAAGAQDAFVEPVEPGALLGRLEPLLARRWRGLGLQPRLDRGILRVEMGEIGDEILDHVHVRQRRDPNLAALDVLDRGRAGEPVLAVEVHRARTANPLAARTTEGQRRILLALDLDQRVEDHRPATVEIDLEPIVAGVLAAFGIVAVYLEGARSLRVGRCLVDAAPGRDLAVLRKRELSHANLPVRERDSRSAPRAQCPRLHFSTTPGAANLPGGVPARIRLGGRDIPQYRPGPRCISSKWRAAAGASSSFAASISTPSSRSAP